MSKHNILTEDEMDNFRPNPEVIRYIENARKTFNIPKNEMKILDWGCGRGRLVAWLRLKGYKAYGVDVDSLAIENSTQIFNRLNENDCVQYLQLTVKSKTNFPNDHFDMVISDNVMEHIRDLPQVVDEIARITAPWGRGFHLYPASRAIQEGHLNMPFIHWLPKNKLRKSAITLCVILGKEPNWKELKSKNLLERATTYFEYSREKTYYRTIKETKKIWQAAGFSIEFVGKHHPKIKRLSSIIIFEQIISWFINHFILTEIETKKEGLSNAQISRDA